METYVWGHGSTGHIHAPYSLVDNKRPEWDRPLMMFYWTLILKYEQILLGVRNDPCWVQMFYSFLLLWFLIIKIHFLGHDWVENTYKKSKRLSKITFEY